MPAVNTPTESAELLRLVFDHAGEGISIFDEHLRLRAWNARFLQLTGIDPACAYRGVALLDLLLHQAQAGEFGALAPQEEAQRRLVLMRDGGNELIQRLRPNGRSIEVRRNPLPGGGLVLLYADITARIAAEAQALGEQRMLALLMQRTEQGFWFIDNQLRTTNANPAMCRMLDVSLAQMMGRDIYAFVDDTNAAIFRHHVGLRQGGQAQGYEISLRRADGSLVHCYNNATPIVGPAGRMLGALGMFTDITAGVQAQRALRDSEQRFRTMADGAPALIWQSDAAGLPIWFNQRWLAHTGRSMAEELTLPWSSRMHPDDLQRCLAVYKVAAAHPAPYTVEFRLLSVHGGTVWIADSGIPQVSPAGAGNETFEGYIGYGWEITQRKAAEAALIAAKDEAERANRAKSEFLSRMSHELRTPLNAVLGFGQLLERDELDPLTNAQRGRVQELLRGGRHLLSLINDVLDLARIEAGTLQLLLVPVDVADVVGDCLRLVQPMAAERHISLRLDQAPPPAQSPWVQADATRLRQVLLNLLSNAIKYNHAGGSVHLRWWLEDAGQLQHQHQHQHPHLRIDITDSGPGLSTEQQARLFQAFERLDAERTSVEGAGIGLALSKWLVELMHGQIGVHSQPGQGSTFWLRLELAQAGARAAAVPPPPPQAVPAAVAPARSAQPARSVLYIEDNPINQLLMQGMLGQRPQLQLRLASLPEAGLLMATQAPPDLVLLDIQLPQMDGFEVLRRLRLNPITRHIPVVAVSANAMHSDLEQARAAGFADYVTKPLDLQRLLAVVDRVLANGA